jgi:circadian clock protein KaiC
VTLLSGSAGIGKSTFGVQFVLAGAAAKEPGLYVALEEGPAQLVASARALGLPLEDAVDAGLVELLYLPRELVRPNQFLTLLTDRLSALKARRLVIDSVSHIGPDEPAGLHPLLQALTARFKSLGVTTILTYEARSLHAMEMATDQGFSAVADNIVLLRYQAAPGELRPIISIIKTRGSAHAWRAHHCAVAAGGLRVGEPVARADVDRGEDAGAEAR